MARYIELSVNWVERGEDGQPDMTDGHTRNMGSLRWNADEPGVPPAELASIDNMTIELMRAYVEWHDARMSAWKKKVSKMKELAAAGDASDLRHAMRHPDEVGNG